MPLPSNSLDAGLTAINAITRKYYFPELVDQITTSNALLMEMKRRGNLTTVSGGDDIRQPVRFARGVQQNYSGGEDLTTSAVEKKTNLIFAWKQKNFPITISGIDKIKNNGPEKVIDHIESETQAAKEDAEDSFGTGLYSAGTDTKEITGARVFLSTSNTYGGISQSSSSWLQAKIDSTTTAISVAKMQERYEAATEGNDKPNLITTDESEFNAYFGLLQPQQRFADSKMADAGFQNILFRGAPVMEDSYCPNGYMVFWNMKYLKLVSSTQRKFPGEFIDFEMPINQDVMVAHIRWAGNLVCSQPRKFAALTALAD